MTISIGLYLDTALAALGHDLSDGLQLHAAAAVAAMHYPPLSPSVAVLILDISDIDEASRLKDVLVSQYGPDHMVKTLVVRGNDCQLQDCDLAAVDADDVFSAGMMLYVPGAHPLGSFERLQETMAHLRSPEGCPWDREQTHESLRPYLIEEAYEVLEALDAGDVLELKEELGDLLLQVVFHTQVAIEAGEFRMPEVLQHINSKLINRHPHVWGDIDVNDSHDVARNWEAIKKQERKDNGSVKKSLLDGISRALPALSQAYNYQVRAARVGFDWQEIDPVIDKINEEIAEIRAVADPEQRTSEIGDLLFALVNWIRWTDVEPETALREANQRFYRRFNYIEQAADRDGRTLSDMSLADMDVLWDEAKSQGL